MRGLYLLQDGRETNPIVFPIVDLSMALLTYGHLLAIDRRHVEGEALHLLAPFSDVSDVVHLDLFLAATDGTIVQEPGLCPSRSPGGANGRVDR